MFKKAGNAVDLLLNRQLTPGHFDDSTYASSSDMSDSVEVPLRSKNLMITPEYIYFFDEDFYLAYTDLNVPIDEFLENSKLRHSDLDVIYLLDNLPKIAPNYVQRVYFDCGHNLINGTLPTQTDYYIDAPSDNDQFMSENGDTYEEDPDMDKIMSDDQLLKEMDNANALDYFIDNEDEARKNEIDNLQNQTWADYVEEPSMDDVNHSTYPNDDIASDENVIKGKSDDFNDYYHTIENSIERTPEESFEKPKLPQALNRKQYIYPDRFQRTGTKSRGSGRCNLQSTSKKWTRKREKLTLSDQKRLATVQREKKALKKKQGKQWKGREALSKQDKAAKLLSQAFHHARLQRAGEIDGKIESDEIELDKLMYPQINSEFYTNASLERQFYIDNIKRLNEEKKKKQYQTHELTVNKSIRKEVENWKSEDLLSYSRTSNIIEDIEILEKFVASNVTDELLIKEMIGTAKNVIEKNPTMLDRASKFIETLISKVKPLAFGVDTIRDIALGVDILKDEHKVVLSEPIPYASLITMYGFDSSREDPDLRDDHARRGELIHKDPLLNYFDMEYIHRDGPISTSSAYSGVVSMELLFQLTSPSIMVMNATEDIVFAKMQHCASNIHSINLPKNDILKFHTKIVEDTLLVAQSIFKTRRRIAKAMGFSLSPA